MSLPKMSQANMNKLYVDGCVKYVEKMNDLTMKVIEAVNNKEDPKPYADELATLKAEYTKFLDNKPSTKGKTTHYVVVLPVDEEPYILDEVNDRNDLKVLQTAVNGYIEAVPYRIDVPDTPKWKDAHRVFRCRGSRAYFNEDGAHTQPINRNLKVPDSELCVYGAIAVKITKKAFEALNTCLTKK